MAFDGFVLKSVIKELNSCLLGGKITKIYQPNSEEIFLGVYSHGLQYFLSCNISSQFYSLHLTTHSKPNPLSAPNFCMVLRKYLIGYKIKSISMIGLERIATIELEGYNELNDLVTKKLVIELMGKHSNIILLNQENNIIDSLKHFDTFSGSYRNILPGYLYSFPISDKLDITSIQPELLQENNSKSLVNYFTEHYSGISKTLIEYSLSVLSIPNILTLSNFKKVVEYLYSLLKCISEEKINCILFENDYTITPGSFSSLQVNFFIDDFYTKKEIKEEFLQYRNTMLALIMKQLKKVSTKIKIIDDKLQECSNMDQYKIYGELLTTYMYKISNTHLNSIVLENYYENNDLISIPLDIAFSPSENAKRYFKKYRKLKNTLEIVTEQKLELEKEIDYLESVVYELQNSKTIVDIDIIYNEIQEANLLSKKASVNKKHVYSKKMDMKNKEISKLDFINYKLEDFTVLVGKNNRQNDYLTTKLAKPDDLWFHVKGLQGSHTILIIDSKNPSQEIINKCAAIAAFHSKAKQSSNVPVDYTYAKYVKKPSKSKPGMVVYTHQQTVNIQPQI